MKNKTKKMKLKTQIQYWVALVFAVGISIITLQIAQFDSEIRQKLINTTFVAKASGTAVLDPTEPLTIEEHICRASNGEYCELLVNLAKCESSMNKDAWNVNTNGTVDFGLYQINSVHKDISLLEKLDVYASTRWTVNKIKDGDLHIWVCAKFI